MGVNMVVNRKNLIIFLSCVIFAAGCNAFVVPAVYISSAVLGNTTHAQKNATAIGQKPSGMNENLNAVGSATSGTPEGHISGNTSPEHISGASASHICGATIPEHISGTLTDHISGAALSNHVSGASIPKHLSGAAMMPEHLSGN
jgi:hypothetical protein